MLRYTQSKSNQRLLLLNKGCKISNFFRYNILFATKISKNIKKCGKLIIRRVACDIAMG